MHTGIMFSLILNSKRYHIEINRYLVKYEMKGVITTHAGRVYIYVDLCSCGKNNNAAYEREIVLLPESTCTMSIMAQP